MLVQQIRLNPVNNAATVVPQINYTKHHKNSLGVFQKQPTSLVQHVITAHTPYTAPITFYQQKSGVCERGSRSSCLPSWRQLETVVGGSLSLCWVARCGLKGHHYQL